MPTGLYGYLAHHSCALCSCEREQIFDAEHKGQRSAGQAHLQGRGRLEVELGRRHLEGGRLELWDLGGGQHQPLLVHLPAQEQERGNRQRKATRRAGHTYNHRGLNSCEDAFRSTEEGMPGVWGMCTSRRQISCLKGGQL